MNGNKKKKGIEPSAGGLISNTAAYSFCHRPSEICLQPLYSLVSSWFLISIQYPAEPKEHLRTCLLLNFEMNQNRIFFLDFSCIPFHPPDLCIEHRRLGVYLFIYFPFVSLHRDCARSEVLEE